MCDDFGLKPELIEKIINITCGYKKVEKIVLFGSRVTGEFKKVSDIDIAIFDKSWEGSDINIVKHMLDEKVNTSLKFDVLNYYSLKKDSLKNQIVEKGRVIYERAKD
ncbi:MAG: nucleotidyltransferase domain-containing protein [Candidatus Omnitrophota bacterium]